MISKKLMIAAAELSTAREWVTVRMAEHGGWAFCKSFETVENGHCVWLDNDRTLALTAAIRDENGSMDEVL